MQALPADVKVPVNRGKMSFEIWFISFIFSFQNEKERNMNKKHQIITDQEGKPLFALIPYEEYLMLQKQMNETRTASTGGSLLSEDGLRISLPHAPGEHIDLVRLVDYCVRTHQVSMGADDDLDEVRKEYGESFPVNMRTQALANFDARQLGSLDPLIRAKFLSKNSPYRNTMQATTEVVNALVSTGIFVPTKRKFDFYRPVNALDFNVEAAKEFLAGKPAVKDPIKPYFWYKSPLDKDGD